MNQGIPWTRSDDWASFKLSREDAQSMLDLFDFGWESEGLPLAWGREMSLRALVAKKQLCKNDGEYCDMIFPIRSLVALKDGMSPWDIAIRAANEWEESTPLFKDFIRRLGISLLAIKENKRSCWFF